MAKEIAKGNYPCKVEGSFMTPCSSLYKALDNSCSPNGRSKGLFYKELINLRTGAVSSTFILLKLGEFQKNGVVMNVCPFCGVNVSSHIKEASHAG